MRHGGSKGDLFGEGDVRQPLDRADQSVRNAPASWQVIAPYFETASDRWIIDAVDSPNHTFDLVPRARKQRNWHQSGGGTDGFSDWIDTARQAYTGFRQTDSGVITVFPQLAAAAGLMKVVSRSDRPLVAWLFNTENIKSLVRRTVAQASLRAVDTFVVHSTNEISAYSSILGIPSERFEFVPQQYGGAIEYDEPTQINEPYVFATGSAYRDYRNFFAAVEKLNLKTLVLASDGALKGLEIPSCVTVLEQIPRPEIRRLVRHARVNVVPLTTQAEAAGLITIVEAFRHGRAVVTTDRRGLEDYIFPEKTALTTKPGDSASMAEAIEAMWNDRGLRESLDANAFAFAQENCTDESAAQSLYGILDRLS